MKREKPAGVAAITPPAVRPPVELAPGMVPLVKRPPEPSLRQPHQAVRKPLVSQRVAKLRSPMVSRHRFGEIPRAPGD